MINEGTARIKRNNGLLGQCDPVFRRKMAAILADLEGHGLKPRVQESWRSSTRQRTLQQQGFTQLAWSFHNAKNTQGQPAALAVDLVDDEHPLQSPTRFLLMLASASRAHGCETGILWGLTKKQRETVNQAIEQKEWDTNVIIGWDPEHVQIAGISVREAKEGKRPE